ncbi:ATP-dependent DNA helicase RecG [Micrococcus flavus]|uniref:Probable DNA 3'-5' helicase RecG n=1 Tax=Micrococcus flavus TaxID=384602 RepID=A0A4Y8X3Z4_9MICC|nr:ATP-dependent DNA helicase RecG [Micrococcus flavus]MBB4882969.1 ATP-dependent DNA helicase RecG [Micrococcus flavus]TFI04393.1 ATP-dependent DNA helicase RecG [Micrococcus flavus]GGK41335.1 ATP-dependent DNA helicase RecG [Micrococcus flavus]
MPAESVLDTPLEEVLSGRLPARLAAELSLTTVGELLDHTPRRWVERGELTPIAALPVDAEVTVVARVESVGTRRMRSRAGFIVDVTVADPSVEGVAGASLSMAFFNGHDAKRRLAPGVTAMFQGRTTLYRGAVTLNNPDFALLDDDVAPGEVDVRPVPLYRATGKLPSWTVRSAVARVLADVDLDAVPELLTPSIRERAARVLDLPAPLPSTADAYRSLHAPEDLAQTGPARTALALREALVAQAALAWRRARERERAAVARPRLAGGLLDALDARLPFALTPGQVAVGEELAAELAGTAPMSRLLQGDVGAGKTLVALRAMLQAVDAGGQAALVAPTEVLAAQHHRALLALLGPLARDAGILSSAAGEGPAVDVVLVTGSQRTPARREALLKLASGQAGIAVGTHALLSEKVAFADLALAVVDEQHRFGVDQREALRRANPGTHLLVMSATPIPRSVAMTVFGDLDLSVLEGLPSGRQPVATHVARMAHGPRVIARVWEVIAEHVAAGHQAFVVCPRIDPDDADPGHANVEEMAPRLRALPGLAGLRIGTVHGRMDQAEQDAAMRAFAAGELDVLVATTVVEVGVDVPNATVMAVLDADDFGLSTLHQLRGRVGRGPGAAICLLATRLPDGHPSLRRLEVLEATQDGMRIAQADLAQRGVGDVLGAAQSGLASGLTHVDVLADAPLIALAADVVADVMAAGDGLSAHPALAAEVTRWEAEHLTAADYLEKG